MVRNELSRLAAAALFFCAAGASGSFLELYAPNGGEQYSQGDTIAVTWVIDRDSVLNGVLVEISFDGGIIWYIVSGASIIGNDDTAVYSGAGDTGIFSWEIPVRVDTVTVAGRMCRMRVRAPYEDARVVYDASDDDFRILDAGGPDGPDGGGGCCGRGAETAVLAPVVMRMMRKRKRAPSFFPALFSVFFFILVPAFTAGVCCARKPSQGGEMRPLPAPVRKGSMSVEEAIAKRRSIRTFAQGKLTDGEISQLLWAAQGLTDSLGRFRSAPSAGATYPLETYIVTGEGIFKYIVEKHALSVVKKGDFRKALADAALGQDCVRHAAATIVLTCVAGRTTARYGNRGQMYIHIEAGHAAQNIHLEAVALGLGSVPVGAFDDAQAAETLGCGGREQPLYMIPVGRIGK